MFFILVYIVKSSHYILIAAKYRTLHDALFCKKTCSIMKWYKYFDTTTVLQWVYPGYCCGLALQKFCYCY